jgi:hypothetical protein
MADHAGFAAAVTVREHVLDIALQAAYANGSFPRTLAADLPGDPPGVRTDLFLGQPRLRCEGATNLLVLTVATWGTLRITAAGVPERVVRISGELEATIRPVFVPGPSLQLAPSNNDIVVRRWTASVLSTDTPPDTVSFVVGDAFRLRLQTALRFAIAFQQVKLPSIDATFLGPIAFLATSVSARVRGGALVLGLTTDTITGDTAGLNDFARTHDLAGVINSAATALFLDELHTRLATAVEENDATLQRFTAVPVAGRFAVSGAAGNSSGTVNFSFQLVPSMFHTRPGTTFRFLPKTRHVNTRTWPALKFLIENVRTDVDRAWWVVLFGEVLGGIVTGGFLTLYIEGAVASTAANFSARLKAADTGVASPRVRRTVPPAGGVGVRIGVDAFEVTTVGTFVGISVRAEPTPAALIGAATLSRTYAGDSLRYRLRPPSGVPLDDPALRIRWTLEDRTSGAVLADVDGVASARDRFDFTPADHPAAADFGVTARLYRRLGPVVTELGIESITVRLRPSVPPGSYVRWRSEVANPQVALHAPSNSWVYRGEVRVRRWSEWHRTDAPCRAVDAPARYRFEEETADRLPFPLRLLESHRKGLCPYCFTGGPAGLTFRL